MTDRFTLADLEAIVAARAAVDDGSSYTRKLLDKGVAKCAQKLGEEAVETVIASKNMDKKEILYEMGDLWYHCLVLLAFHNISPEDLFAELMDRRSGGSYHKFEGKTGVRPDM